MTSKTYYSGALPSGMRDYNERLLLTMIRRLGPIAGSDLARAAGLSAQTVSVILRKLESDELLQRGEPQKGRVGKPSVPYCLNPDGAFGFGMKLGRRSADLALIDLVGGVRDQLQVHYDYPRPDRILAFLREGVEQMTRALPTASRSRVEGIGLAMPFDLWKWNEEVGATSDEIASWQSINMQEEIGKVFDAPVMVTNDATAGCYAETIFGTGEVISTYAYFFVGFFVGGGIVMDSSVYEGPSGNAGAIGPLRTKSRDGKSVQLMDVASLHRLEGLIEAQDGDPSQLWDGTENWASFGDELAVWIDEAAFAIAGGALSACALVDFEAIVIDGAFPIEVRARLVAAIKGELVNLDTRGIVIPEILEGKTGPNARVIGAAYSPIAARYFLKGSSSYSAQVSPLAG